MTEEAAKQALARTLFAEVHFRREVTSTNDDVMALAAAGAPEGTVVVAEHQTAGRGRAGRPWLAPAGSSLLVSVLLRPRLPADLLPITTLAAALAAADACHEVGGFRPLLKWPNDLVVGSAHGEKKLGGVLAEVRVSTASRRHRPANDDPPVVLGLGINVDWDEPPSDIAGTAVTASEVARRPVDRHQLLVAFLRVLDRRYGELETVAGRERIVEEYRRRCSTLGRDVIVEMARSNMEGRAVDVDPKGSLVVQDRAGAQHTVRAGDVIHLTPSVSSRR